MRTLTVHTLLLVPLVLLDELQGRRLLRPQWLLSLCFHDHKSSRRRKPTSTVKPRDAANPR